MTGSLQHRIGIYLAVVQFLFTTTWTVYVIFLPALAVQAGMSRETVPFLLLVDQLVFLVTDYAMGVMADRVARVVGRLGSVVLGITLVSSLAFLMLPTAAGAGTGALFMTLALLWVASSSALRAPPLVLLGKYAAKPAQPWLSALSLFGLGVAGAVAPYLSVALRDFDPRIPFALSSAALALATMGIMWAERALAGAAAPAAQGAAPAAAPLLHSLPFLLAVALLGFGFQVHLFVNSTPLFLRVASPAQLQYLQPVFWVGFSLIMLPASLATRRYGGVAVMAAGAAGGAAAVAAAFVANHLLTLLLLQFLAGGAWGCVLMSAVAAALRVGHTGGEGRVTGALFALLAAAAVIRLGMVLLRLPQDAAYGFLLRWLPALAWAAAAALLLSVWASQSRKSAPAAAQVS